MFGFVLYFSLPLHSFRSLFSDLIAEHREAYLDAVFRPEKMHVVQLVVGAVNTTGGGRFLKYEEHLEGWVEVSEAVARNKVRQAFQYKRRVEQQDKRIAAAIQNARVGEQPRRPRYNNLPPPL